MGVKWFIRKRVKDDCFTTYASWRTFFNIVAITMRGADIMLTGNRTFLAVAVMIAIQLAKSAGIEVVESDLTTTVNTVGLLVIGFFAWLKQRRLVAAGGK